MIRITRLIQKFGTVSNLSDWAKDVAQSKTPVIVDFYASWCGPCKRLTPLLEKQTQSHPNVSLIKVDIDQFGDIAAQYKVEAVPTVLLFKDGKQVDQFVGLPNQDRLNSFFNQIPKQ